MAGHDIIVIGASAGGVEALTKLVGLLPADLPASIFIVLHIAPQGKSVLPRILTRAGHLPAFHAADEQPIEPGRIYVAPPDHHLLVKQGFVKLSRGPHENNHRPAVDPLFRSAARAYGPRVIGVVLSGVLDDGTSGLLAIKTRGGIAVAQDPNDALYPNMPLSAIDNAGVDHIVSIDDLGPLLVRLSKLPAAESPAPVSEFMETEAEFAELDQQAVEYEREHYSPSSFVCPACGGTLYELHEGPVMRFRCRVGHAFTADTLMAAEDERLEGAFWIALRTLEESGALAQRLADRARAHGNLKAAERFESQVEAARLRAKTIRDVLLSGTLKQIDNGALDFDDL